MGTLNSLPILLADGYTTEVDVVTQSEWSSIIGLFRDANVYQTWSYDAIRCGEENVSHLVLRVAGKIVAAAQVRIVSLPFLGLGAAYVRWGPLWQLRNQTSDPVIYRLAVRSLRDEYVRRRGLILRIFPELYECDQNPCRDILLEEGYTKAAEDNRPHTLVLDISPSIEVLRAQLAQKWRNCLSRAERNELEIIQGTDDCLFSEFIGIYQNLLRRKQFQEPNDINEFRLIQSKLPAEFKMRIFLCRSKGYCSAGAIVSAIGDTGVYLFGATNDRGLQDKASYLIQWKAIQWMKESGCRFFNLNGINPLKNPGTYHFKAGLAGKAGKDVYYLGRFDCYSGLINAVLFQAASWVFPLVKKTISYSGLHRR